MRISDWSSDVCSSDLLQKDLKLKTGGGVESQLEPRFLKKGKPIIGLETVEGQLGIFDSLPEAAQRQFLTQVVEEADSADNTYKIMVTAWLSGDRSEEHTSELQSQMSISNAAFGLKQTQNAQKTHK